MGELGETLREARDAMGLSLAQVEEATRIRTIYLHALEEEDHGRLPPPVYVRGFLKNYAQYLGLDPQHILSLYQPAEVRAPTASAPMMLDEPLEPLNLRRWWPVGVIVLIVTLAAVAWWAYPRYANRLPLLRTTPTPTTTPVPSSPTPEPPTATPLPTQTPLRSPTPGPTPVTAAVELILEIVTDRAWILVEVDGQMAYTGILEAGTTDAWTANERIAMSCGNAGAVRVTVNGEALGFLGEMGQVVTTEWTAPGVPTRTPEV